MHPGLRSTALAAAALLGGCGAPGSANTAPAPPDPIDPAFVPAFDALTAAVDAHDDELARRILQRIQARRPDTPTARRAEAFERILDGRALTAALDMRLVQEQASGGHIAVFFEARHDLDRTLRVRTAPAMLELLLAGVDRIGFERHSARSVAVGQIADFEIPPGAPIRIGLGDFELVPGTALAVRGRWSLVLLPGDIYSGGEPFPATGFEVAPCSVVRLAAFLPSAEVEPAELLRYLEEDAFSTPAMLERAVRIDSDRRAEALDLLTPYVLASAPPEIERAVPALRWLSGRRELGGDPLAWQSWLRARADRRTEDERVAPALDLPALAL